MPISPNQGSTSGGTTVTITGVNLSGATAVHFGSRTATITANTPTSITVIDPAGCGVVDVNVVTAGGTSNSLSFFYISPPIAMSIGPGSGPTAGGNTVTINGYGLSTANTVSFGSNSATPTVVSDSQLSVVVPAGSSSGSVDVAVTTTGGTTSPLSYAYVDAPTLVSLAPASGPASGGTAVTVNGTGLASTTAVTFDGTTASFAVLNNTTLVAVTPSGTAGSVDVVVTTGGGSATVSGGFTYVSGPGI
ncbi:IPT/TIG domain-containing protein [Streptomyces sp. P01-B04]|uniref:IPT/TIG domain-containing protein n=1 Tax=Streptomyces poriferorum TaxID=2798799 RepID=UPI001C5EFF98|nr:IPT/TIG domain-containing protein [Streptomyces poriferorum]MBW5248070.1 IPT/TIG domain-containing protein [Streptomyces poriferorum]MBW5255172.1 IPT/TIG domain-containing protein [Streptomyces poriferorum]